MLRVGVLVSGGGTNQMCIRDRYNPDGKEMIARDNEVSILRKEDVSKAYFGVHTDITIPYKELERISAVREDGTKVDLILDGRFVLAGLDELNRPLGEE